MGMIRVLDHINQCYSNSDGQVIQNLILKDFANGEQIVLSFAGVDSASSSFLNTALIELLNNHTFDYIKSNLTFINTTRSINESIKKRFMFEVNNRKKLINV